MVSKGSSIFYPIFRYSSIVLFLAISAQAGDNSSLSTTSTIIYYGDSEVEIGKPFSISCIVSISEPVKWLKNGNQIDLNDSNYLKQEHNFKGKGNMIEASISVLNALPEHEGQYKCNTLSNTTFALRVVDKLNKKYQLNNFHFNDKMDSEFLLKEHFVETDEFEVFNKNPKTSINETMTVNQNLMTSSNKENLLVFKTETPMISSTITSRIKTISSTISTETEKKHETALNKNIVKIVNQTPIMDNKSYSIKSIIINKLDVLVPNYEYPALKLRSFDIWTPLILSCNITSPKSEKFELHWTVNGTDAKKVLGARVNILNAERKLIIDRPIESDAGEYVCTVNELPNAAGRIKVIANVVAKLPKNTPVVEGERLTITCIAVGTEPVFSWEIGNQTFDENTEDGRVKLSKDELGHENAVLTYEIVKLEDRGNFTCLVRNNDTAHVLSVEPARATTYVRVKGKYAALWPFIGICAEVFVLCAIILIYEKRRNKQDPEESDTDSPELKNDHHGKDSDVRQRK